MDRPGDTIQITYFRDLSPVMEVIQSFYVGNDRDWLYLKSGRYRRTKIQAYRNITEEKSPPRIEEE